MFHDSEFSSMSFKVHGAKDIKDVPNIENLRGFAQIIKSYKAVATPIIKYICYMYDQSSPMKRHYPELTQRKKECSNLSGLAKHENIEEAMIDMVSELFIISIDEFLKHQNNRIWSMIVSNEEVFYEYQSKLLVRTEEERDKDLLQALQIKSKIMNDMDEINKRLEAYYDKLYQGDQELAAKVVVKNITPEDIADLNV
jgi:hypothetical protein